MVFHLFSWHVHVTYSFKNLDFLNNPNCDDDESGRFSAWLLKTLFVFYQIRASIIIAFMFTICPSPLLIVEVTHQYTESRGCSCHWLRYKGIHHRRSAGSTPMWRESDHFFSFHTTVENKKFFFFFFFFVVDAGGQNYSSPIAFPICHALIRQQGKKKAHDL